jgi:hypothetical protein
MPGKYPDWLKNTAKLIPIHLSAYLSALYSEVAYKKEGFLLLFLLTFSLHGFGVLSLHCNLISQFPSSKP